MATSTDSGDDAMVEATQNEEMSSVQGAAGMAKDRSLDNVPSCHNGVLASTLPQQPNIHKSQIFINACNRIIALNVNLQCDSVEEVKRVIHEREGIPVKEQHLIVAGKPLRQGTFLRDYDALGHQSTVDVSMRLRGGARIQEKTLQEILTLMQPLLIDNISIPGVQQQDTMPVLSKLGRRILHGVLSCVLTAHGAGLVYNNDDDNNGGGGGGGILWDQFRVVCVVYEEGTTEFVRVIYLGDGVAPAGPEDRLAKQEKDYKNLMIVIKNLFPPATMPLHVLNIYIVLENLATSISASAERRTQLLQAHAAMVSSSVGVATMCVNLKRFYDQLGHKKAIFSDAMNAAKSATTTLHLAVNKQSLFKKVYNYDKQQYRGNTGMDLFMFARDWFTHVPNQRWVFPPRRAGRRRRPNGNFTGLPHLDNIFTHHFSNFMPEALRQLYMNFDDHNLLTEVLVPLAR